MTTTTELEQLYFHDSQLREIRVHFGDATRGSARITIDYYDWEGNEEHRKRDPESPWTWRVLTIVFGFVARLEFSSPDVMGHATEIMDAEFGVGLDPFFAEQEKAKRSGSTAPSPLFDAPGGAVGLLFKLRNWGDEGCGRVLVVGSNVSLEWTDSGSLHGQIHIPAG